VARPVERLALRPDDSLSLHTLDDVQASLPVPPAIEHRSPAIEQRASRSPADESLDEYFDRLDAAFATLNNTTPPVEKPPEEPPRVR
jgi:hypothetical protein